MADPTYDRKEIDTNYEWKIAFLLSEIYNDDAPIGWSKYIPAATAAVNEAKKIAWGTQK